MKNEVDSSAGDGRKDFHEFRQLTLRCVSDASALCKQGRQISKINIVSTSFIHAVAELLAAERIDHLTQVIRGSLARHDCIETIGTLDNCAVLAQIANPNSPFALRVQQLKQTIETKMSGNEAPTPQ